MGPKGEGHLALVEPMYLPFCFPPPSCAEYPAASSIGTRVGQQLYPFPKKPDIFPLGRRETSLLVPALLHLNSVSVTKRLEWENPGLLRAM